MRRQGRTWLAFGAALVLGAGAAQADEKQKSSTATPEQAGEKAAATKEISGRVVQSGPSKLFVEHMGAVVEFNLAADAQFSGGDIKSGMDLKEGQEVRTSFTVENETTNVAKRVTLAREAAEAPGKAAEPGSAMPPGHPSAPPGAREPGTAPSPR